MRYVVTEQPTSTIAAHRVSINTPSALSDSWNRREQIKKVHEHIHLDTGQPRSMLKIEDTSEVMGGGGNSSVFHALVVRPEVMRSYVC